MKIFKNILKSLVLIFAILVISGCSLYSEETVKSKMFYKGINKKLGSSKNEVGFTCYDFTVKFSDKKDGDAQEFKLRQLDWIDTDIAELKALTVDKEYIVEYEDDILKGVSVDFNKDKDKK